MPKSLDAQSILHGAATRHGLEPYVTGDIERRFTAFVGLFNAFGAIEAADYPLAAEQMESFVAKRLQLERDWSQHPEILTQPVAPPFFVIGHPRSGTTVLQCLLALEAGHRRPCYWETRRPSPPPGMEASADAAAIAAETRHVQELLRMAPQLLCAHPYLDQGGLSEAECEDLMSLDFHFLHTLHFTRVPSLPHPIEAADSVAALSFHKRLLQQFQWKVPTGRWVCKGTLHIHKLPALWRIYPDATCFWTHRAPEDYFASFFAMLDTLYRPVNRNLYRRVDATSVIAHMQMAYEEMLRSDWIDDPRICHIRCTDLFRDPVESIRRCYASGGLAFTPAHEAAIRTWMADPAHRADRHGKFQYSLEQFGLSARKIRTAFAGYYERFDL